VLAAGSVQPTTVWVVPRSMPTIKG
jgi:hypothetical protein